MPRILFTAGAVVCAALVLPGAADRGVSFEQRVAAQRVLDRLRYTHQEGATRSFDENYPRRLSEARVRTQLAESVALEQFWKTPITSQMLQREMERIAESTLFPDRLLEIYAAFDHDPLLVQEALARPALTERLTRDFFATDERIHGEARAEAERLREKLMQELATVEPAQPGGNARLRILEMVVEESESPGIGKRASAMEPEDREHGSRTLETLTAAEYAAERSRLPEHAGDIGAIEEDRDAFVIRRVLSESRISARIAVYQVPKTSWQTWWSGVQGRFSTTEARAVARSAGPLPRPGTRGPAERRRGQPEPANEEPDPALCAPDDTWDTQSFQFIPRPLSEHQAAWTGQEMIVWGGRNVGGFRYDPLIDSWKSMSSLGAPERGNAVWTGSEMIVWDDQAGDGGRYDPVADTWRPISRVGAPSPRRGSAVVWTGRELLLWGGWSKGYYVENSGVRYDPAADRWTRMSNSNSPHPRTLDSAFWTGSEMIVWGGSWQGGGRYDPERDRWATMSISSLAPNEYISRPAWTGKSLIVWGGHWDSPPQGASYDPATNQWYALPSETAAAIYRFEAIGSAGQELILFKGAEGRAFNPDTGEVRPISMVNAPGSRKGFSTVWTGNQMIFWGGGTNAGGRYDVASDTWTPTARPAGPPTRTWHQSVWTGNEMIVMGGPWPGLLYGLDTAERFDPLTNQWGTLPRHEAFIAGRSVWTGRELIVFNGYSGGRYDLDLEKWLPMSLKDAPLRRRSHSMIWTGKEMLLWGGHEDDDDDVGVYTSVTSSYDPATDSWSTVSNAEWSTTDPTAPPRPRDGHGAIWTGTEMIVWGGFNWGYRAEGGGAFNPTTRQWRKLNDVGAPEGADGIAWTGREMLVWHRETPARYHPLTDTWKPISHENAPMILDDLAGIETVTWAGSALLVWGGIESGSTGARYDPDGDAWSPMSTMNAPSPRRGHTAVWTGRGLIVWGGTSSAHTSLQDGGNYTFSTDRDRDASTTCEGDCDDRDSGVHPGAVELPGNSLDENCDGVLACDPSSEWASDALFVRCVARECARLVRAGDIPRDECSRVISRARHSDSCGDRAIDPHELCDGAVVAETCADLGFDGGTLYCNETCDGYNVSECTTRCGDGRRAGFEACDGADLDGASCAGFGFDGGDLACHASCLAFDQRGCTSFCGDGVRSGREACDAGDFGGRTCEDFNFDRGSLSCSASCDWIDTSSCSADCGDGRRRGTELCDGGDVGADSCPFHGFNTGTLLCNDTCDGLDLSRCNVCGDGVLQEGETCDGDHLGGGTCLTQGYRGGTLACNSSCTGYETEGCYECGNGRRELDEECDRYDRAPGDTCETHGFNTGWLLCTDECRIDVSMCAHCGDGIKSPGELCEAGDVGDSTCQHYSFDSGTLACDASCQGHDKSGCTNICGNDRRGGPETCDGSDLGGRSCSSFGFTGGTLACNETCSGFDKTGCARCGDEVISGLEECEPGDPLGETCQSLGFAGGELDCGGKCLFDDSDCWECGNNRREGAEICDRYDVRETCEMLGFDGGRLGCDSTCGYDTSQCTDCGDGIREGAERCDGDDFNGQTCPSLGFLAGPLQCTNFCLIDESACMSTCGDGVRHRPEDCDGSDFGGAACRDLGFSGGALTCNADCTYDTGACTPCGDGIRGDGEECDGADLGGQTCESLGFEGGDLWCSPGCELVKVRCGDIACGDWIRMGTEVCDYGDLAGATCMSLGFTRGDLACKHDCSAFDVSRCSICGDGIIQYGEACDGADLGGQTCKTLAAGFGTLACRADCLDFDLSGCEKY